jgi:hypothetical protein
VTDLTQDRRERLERERIAAEERRQEQLTAQRSPLNAPEERIRIWERLHQIALPVDPNHRLLAVIARQTELRLDEVLDVQRGRAESSPPTT